MSTMAQTSRRRARIARYIAKRVLEMIVLLVVVSAVIFFLAQLLPGDLARSVLGPQASDEQYAALNAKLGLDQPALVRYGQWVWGVLQGDWGTSLTSGSEVSELISSRLARSAALAGFAFALLIPLSWGAGMIGGLREGGIVDRLSNGLGSVLLVIPEFVTGILLILVFGIWLGWFPTSAILPMNAGFGESLRYLFLPALTIVFSLFGYLARFVRMEVIDVKSRPYVRTAHLKGLRSRRIVFRHVLKNAIPTSASVTILQAGIAFGGLLVVETLFSYPGMGNLLVTAATTHDTTVLQAAALTVSAIVLLASFLGDLLHMALDPRARQAVLA